MKQCWYCGQPAEIFDHIIARQKGGTDCISNLRDSCFICNASKGQRSTEEFREILAWKNSGWPYFNPRQRSWLKDRSIRPDAHIFWGERCG